MDGYPGTTDQHDLSRISLQDPYDQIGDLIRILAVDRHIRFGCRRACNIPGFAAISAGSLEIVTRYCCEGSISSQSNGPGKWSSGFRLREASPCFSPS